MTHHDISGSTTSEAALQSASGPRVVRAPRGSEISCKGWQQEAALRMLMNNLDPEVAERPDDLVVYGGSGKAARNWECFDAIVRSLRSLERDETLLVQSGKPVGIFRTHPGAPRVLIANSNLVPHWANWDEFRRLEAEGLTMYGQMTAGSWIYIGSQGIVQGTYETFAEAARQRFGGTLKGTLTLTAGLGGMGGAQPLAITMNEGVCLAVEIDPTRIQRRLDTGYLDEMTDNLDDALRRAEEYRAQGIAQGTYETFAEAARQRFGGTLKGTLTLTAGLGGMGGAQPLAITMNEGVCLAVEIDPTRIQRRLDTGYLDEMTDNLDDALRRAEEYRAQGIARSIALVGNAAEVYPEIVRRNVRLELVTDQTSAHDALNGYIPAGMTLEEAAELRRRDPEEYERRSLHSMAEHVRAMLDLDEMGAVVFDYGNNLRGQALRAGVEDALHFPGFVPAFIRPLFCRGKGPFRWAALSGDPADIKRTDEEILRLFPEDDSLARWIRMAQERIHFQGLPARICWLGYGERDKAGLAFNELVRRGEVKAPIVIGRDHLDSGSVASPYRETERMRDGSDAIADWPILNALLNTASGASWVSFHHGGGVGIGYSLHAGVVIVADGTDDCAERLARVLTNDPGTGVMRHVDAGYPEAIETAQTRGVKIPMLPETEPPA